MLYLIVSHKNGIIVGKGIFSDLKGVPVPETGIDNIIIENPSEELLNNEIEVVQQDDGTYTVQVKQDTRPFCQLILKKDDGNGNLISAYDPNYKAYLFNAGETITIEGKLCLDQGLTTPVPGIIEFRTPVLRNGIQDRVYALKFTDGIVETKQVIINESGIYKITKKEAYKVRLVGESGEIIDEIKIIVAE